MDTLGAEKVMAAVEGEWPHPQSGDGSLMGGDVIGIAGPGPLGAVEKPSPALFYASVSPW